MTGHLVRITPVVFIDGARAVPRIPGVWQSPAELAQWIADDADDHARNALDVTTIQRAVTDARHTGIFAKMAHIRRVGGWFASLQYAAGITMRATAALWVIIGAVGTWTAV